MGLGGGRKMGHGMRIKLFTLRYTATLGGFDERPVQEFARHKEVVVFREHFFTVHDVPNLACVLTWQDAAVTEPDALPAPRRERTDLTEGMNETDHRLNNRLREWRLAKSRAEGVPPYVLFNVAAKPGSANALAQTRGIGTAKVERHGDEVLAILNRTPEGSSVEGVPFTPPLHPRSRVRAI